MDRRTFCGHVLEGCSVDSGWKRCCPVMVKLAKAKMGRCLQRQLCHAVPDGCICKGLITEQSQPQPRKKNIYVLLRVVRTHFVLCHQGLLLLSPPDSIDPPCGRDESRATKIEQTPLGCTGDSKPLKVQGFEANGSDKIMQTCCSFGHKGQFFAGLQCFWAQQRPDRRGEVI